MRRKSTKLLFVLILILLLLIVFLLVAKTTADKTYEDRVASETSTELDIYKMHKFASDNTKQALQALKDGDADTLSSLIFEDADVEKLIEYADWGAMDLNKSNYFGIGSYMTEADKDGRIDVGEQIAIKIGKEKYAIYIQTVASRYGKANDGVACIAVTSIKHFEDTDYTWKWQTDSETLRAGKAFY